MTCAKTQGSLRTQGRYRRTNRCKKSDDQGRSRPRALKGVDELYVAKGKKIRARRPQARTSRRAAELLGSCWSPREIWSANAPEGTRADRGFDEATYKRLLAEQRRQTRSCAQPGLCETRARTRAARRTTVSR